MSAASLTLSGGGRVSPRIAAALLTACFTVLSPPAPQASLAANQLAVSHLSRGVPGAAFPAQDLAAGLLDDNAATAVSLAPGEALEFAFVGAPRWINRLAVSGELGAWRVALRDLEGAWSAWLTGRAATPETIGEPLFATGLRFVAVPTADFPGGVRVAGLKAIFHQDDPDRAGRADAGSPTYHADWINDYPGTDSDLTKCDNDADDMGDKLPNTWTTWLHGDANAHEVHFKNTGIGNGDNNDHADNADLAYFSGHGTSQVDAGYTNTSLGSMKFGDTTHDDAYIVPSDMANAWGDDQMEWLVSTSCQTLRVAGRPYWKLGMVGVHLLCGSDSVIADKSYGEVLGEETVDNGLFDTAVTVKQSWFDAMDEWNGAHEGAVVQAENSTMGNDFIWNEGTVAADPTVDATWITWIYDVGSVAPSPPAPPHAAPALRDPVRIDARPGRGWPVRVDRSLLAGATAPAMPVWNVVPRMVDSFYVRNLANAICASEGILCGGQIGQGAPGELNLIQGQFELRVRQATGGFSATDAKNWLGWRTSRPSLLLGAAAVTRADQVLTNWGVKPADATASSVHYLWQRAETATAGAAPNDSSFSIASTVGYTRRIGTGEGYPVHGPGASIKVTLGGNGSIQRVFGRAWRPLTQGANVSVLPLDSILVALSRLGNGAVLDPKRIPVDSIQVNSFELGYFEPACRENVTALRPVYLLYCTTWDLGVPTAVEYAVTGDAMPLDVDILAPQYGVAVPPGATVCFNGATSGGVPPYTAQWLLDDGTVLGTGSSVCAPINLPSDPHAAGDSSRTVTLLVRDSHGVEGEALVRIRLVTVTAAALDPSGTGIGFTAVPTGVARGAVRVAFRGVAAGAARTTLRAYDATGRLVRTLYDGAASGAVESVSWDRRDEAGRMVAPGVYALRLETGGRVDSRRIVLLP